MAVPRATTVGALLLVAVGVALAEEMPEIDAVTVYPDTVPAADGRPQACVVASSTNEGAAAIARELQAGLQAAMGVELPIVADSEVRPERLGPVAEQWRETNLIIVGNLDTNRAILPLYAIFLCGADSVYPGGDGYELRTVSNPWGSGRNVIVVGGSSVEGMRAAAGALLDAVPAVREGTVRLPRLLDIVPGGEQVGGFAGAESYLQRQTPPRGQSDIHKFWQAANSGASVLGCASFSVVEAGTRV